MTMQTHKGPRYGALFIFAVLVPAGFAASSNCGDDTSRCSIILPCPYPGFDVETCSCRHVDGGTADAGEGRTFTCGSRVDCALIECDLVKAKAHACDGGAGLHIGRRECAGGFVAIDRFGVDVGVTSYYEASSLVAVVSQMSSRTASPGLIIRCDYGPSVFTEPACGDPVPLCASDAAPDDVAGQK
jgi:hypothetical protein